MIRPLFLLPLGLLSLGGCDRSGQRTSGGTSVTINADDGNVLGAVDAKSGEVKVNIPGFSGQIKLPRIQLDATNFDLNGVHLYPGSVIDNMDIGGNDQNAGMRIRFTSPASPAQVRTWFQERLGKAGFTLRQDGQGLVGTTSENKPFRLDLTGDGPAGAKGTIALGS